LGVYSYMIIADTLEGNIYGKLNGEYWAYVGLGLNLDVSTQCFWQFLAYGETQAHALGVELAMVG
jgi:hypothetical protein